MLFFKFKNEHLSGLPKMGILTSSASITDQIEGSTPLVINTYLNHHSAQNTMSLFYFYNIFLYYVAIHSILIYK